jgi:hypothetical protein
LATRRTNKKKTGKTLALSIRAIDSPNRAAIARSRNLSTDQKLLG